MYVGATKYAVKNICVFRRDYERRKKKKKRGKNGLNACNYETSTLLYLTK